MSFTKVDVSSIFSGRSTVAAVGKAGKGGIMSDPDFCVTDVPLDSWSVTMPSLTVAILFSSLRFLFKKNEHVYCF